MTYDQTKLQDVENIGTLDRINRVIAGITLIMVAVLFTAIQEGAIASIVAVGGYLALTAFIGWDPLYAVVKAFQQKAPEQMPASTSLQKQEEQEQADHYKKAA